ncbi:hypothetical protein B0H16DRAFT_1482042 [Mycena metata]|uniref:Uncharacterized protein n=1 Tax=Mycena metata TaxID=1033252 RepID=A0AAD7GV30_9AGAR|nr:hypothetical protein B0H16DRAFT_1482042 [Mycena metata]
MDSDAAATELEHTVSVRRQVLQDRAKSCVVHMADIMTDDLRVTELIEGRKNWRLCVQDLDDDISDEVVVRVQGVLMKNNLVPKNARSKAQFLAQSAEICGLRTKTFDASMSALSSVDQRFSEFLAGTDIIGSSDDTGRSGGGFLASNRVFSFRSDAPTEQDNMFEDGVDHCVPCPANHRV